MQHKTFAICSHPGMLFWTGVSTHHPQCLLVVQWPHLVAVGFATDGAFLDVAQHAVSARPIDLRRIHSISDGLSVAGQPDLWFESVSFKESTIVVQKFFVDDLGIGIREFPKYFSEVLADPTIATEDEYRIAAHEQRRWQEEGVYELWIGPNTDCWMSRDGIIESS